MSAGSIHFKVLPQEEQQFLLVIQGHSIHKVKDSLEGVGRAEHDLREIDVDEDPHQTVAVEAICDASVAWDSVSEVLDAEGTLDSRGEEPSERCDQRGETRDHD